MTFSIFILVNNKTCHQTNRQDIKSASTSYILEIIENYEKRNTFQGITFLRKLEFLEMIEHVFWDFELFSKEKVRIDFRY